LKKTPPPKSAPVQLDFVMARVFDMYRVLASAPATISAQRNGERRAPRKPRESAK
jgi:hypothetical protein